MGLRRSLGPVALLAAALLTAPAARAQQSAFAIADGGTTLITFDTSNPGAATAIGDFTLNGTPTFLDAIDFRPQDGQLYGYLDATNTLYRVNLTTAALTAIPTGPGISNTNLLGMDFNPLTGRGRIVTDTDQNFALDPAVPGMPAIVQGNPFYAPSDPNAGVVPHVIDIGYTNNIAGAFSSNNLFGIDYGTDTLIHMDPVTGKLLTIGALGVDTTPFAGFDIFTDATSHANTAYALLDTTMGNAPTFYTVGLGNGAATSIGAVGGGFTQVHSLAVEHIEAPPPAVPEPGKAAFGLVFGVGLLGLVGRARLRAASQRR
jgi:hypothetical protein